MKKNSLFLCLILLVLGGVALGGTEDKQESAPDLADIILGGVKLRCIGPANMGGRIDDIAVVKKNPHIFYIGTASGGVWKTTNNGTTWKPIFDDQETSTIGDLAVSDSNPDIIWVGTGEPNNRQSSSWGNGMYKSTDGGETWKNMGLQDTHHIGRVVIHPHNPDIVYVAALGHLWGPNKQRGLFKTSDGGKTWTNTKFISQNTGFVDVAMDPDNPDTLYAAAYQRRRRGWGFVGGGPEGGLYKTTDGGETWLRLQNGLPEGDIGRIGIDIYQKDANIVYVVLESKKGGIFRSEDKGLSWMRMRSTNPRPMYYSQIRIDPNNDQRIWVLGAPMYVSEDGGKTFRTNHVTRVHGDHHALWINPADSGHMILGSDGGVYLSYDRGKTWDFVNTIPLAQFYEIGFDMRQPYYVYGGLQDNGSWGGPSSTRFWQGITNEDWIKIGGGDGFYTQVDPEDYNTIYVESQNGYLNRFDLGIGLRKNIRPLPPDEKEIYRFNWNSPILISPHDSHKIYYGGNRLFISEDRGDSWRGTRDLTAQQDRDKLPLMGMLPGPQTLSRHDGIRFYGDITAISESALKPGLLYVGTDDGFLQVSRDDGKTWKNLAEKLPGVAKNTYVTRVVASRFDEGTVYATLDGHRNDDFMPYVFVSNDYGESWKNIAKGLPEGSVVNVIREHHRNPNLLFLGTERGAYFSLNKGKLWIMIKSNFPMVPVDDIAIHPRENDLILGTHGRSIWILDDITFLEHLTPEILSSPAHLFDIKPAEMFNPFSHKGNLGHKAFVAENPPRGAVISYYLKEKIKGDVKILIRNKEGNKKIVELPGDNQAGLNRLTWNLRYPPSLSPQEGSTSRFRVGGFFVLPDEYQVTLKAADTEMIKMAKLEWDSRMMIPLADLKSRHDALYQIYELSPLMNAAVETSYAVKKEIDTLKSVLKKVPDVPENVSAVVKTVGEAVTQIRIDLMGDPQKGREGRSASIRGKLLMLVGIISGALEAPPPEKVEQISVQKQRLLELAEKINTIISTDFPRLNQVLNENNIPRLFPTKPIKFK